MFFLVRDCGYVCCILCTYILQFHNAAWIGAGLCENSTFFPIHPDSHFLNSVWHSQPLFPEFIYFYSVAPLSGPAVLLYFTMKSGTWQLSYYCIIFHELYLERGREYFIKYSPLPPAMMWIALCWKVNY